MKLNINGTDQQKSALYPSVGDQLDAIWKIISNIKAPADAEKVRSKISDVKNKLQKSKYREV